MSVLAQQILNIFSHSSFFDAIDSLAIFGSYAKNEQTEDSDIDVLVSLNKPVGYPLLELQRKLEKEVGKTIDIVTEQGISPYLKDEIEATKEIIYEK